MANPSPFNLRIWNQVRLTDPNRTKSVKLPGGFKATTVDANWLLERATELFGPAGMGFGWSIVSAFETSTNLCTVHLRFWYMLDGARCEFDAIASNASQRTFKDGTAQADDDAFKKALTDAIKSALTKIGFLADIHQGRHDDPSYVERAAAYVERQAEMAQGQAAQPAQQPAAVQDAPKAAPATTAATTAAPLTREQQTNALFIRLKRRDAEAALKTAQEMRGRPDELEETARVLGRLLYQDISVKDAAMAKEIFSKAPKNEAGRVADPVALLDALQEALNNLNSMTTVLKAGSAA
jgi:hypothetical protein